MSCENEAVYVFLNAFIKTINYIHNFVIICVFHEFYEIKFNFMLR